MKLIICLCAVVVVSAVEKEMFQLPPESLKRMHAIAIPCAQEFNVDPSYIHKVGDPDTFPRDEASNKFIFCYATKSGILNADGHINDDKLVGIVGDHPLVPAIREAIAICNQITKEDALATAIAMHYCYGEKFPIRYVF